MYIQAGADPGHESVIVITDHRAAQDGILDRTEPTAAPHVLEIGQLGMFVRLATRGREDRILKVALFDHKQKANGDIRAQARDDLRTLLDKHQAPAVVIVLPTANTRKPEDSEDDLTCVAWQALKMPDSMDRMEFTFHPWGKHLICPLPRIDYRAKELTRWATAQCIRRALLLADGRLEIVRPRHTITTINEDCLQALRKWHYNPVPLAIDIESLEGQSTIMAIGLSDGVTAVSIPFDAYTPAGRDAEEPGIGQYDLGRAVFTELVGCLHQVSAPKYFHNFGFDVPKLNRVRGLVVNGNIEDTFAAHAIAYPELKHGLQAAAASMMACPAWKSAWHPKGKGYTRDDAEFWTCDPVGLREYNALDAFYTARLGVALTPCIQQPAEVLQRASA